MSLLALIFTLVIVGLILWLVNSFIPMDAKIKTILNVVVIIFIILWLAKALGLFGPLESIKVP